MLNFKRKNAKKVFPNSPYDWIYYDISVCPTKEDIKECRMLAIPYLNRGGIVECFWELNVMREGERASV